MLIVRYLKYIPVIRNKTEFFRLNICYILFFWLYYLFRWVCQTWVKYFFRKSTEWPPRVASTLPQTWKINHVRSGIRCWQHGPDQKPESETLWPHRVAWQLGLEKCVTNLCCPDGGWQIHKIQVQQPHKSQSTKTDLDSGHTSHGRPHPIVSAHLILLQVASRS